MLPDHLAYPRRLPDRVEDDARVRNWARNATLAPSTSVIAPRSEDDLRARLEGTEGGVRVIGSRMSPGMISSISPSSDRAPTTASMCERSPARGPRWRS